VRQGVRSARSASIVDGWRLRAATSKSNMGSITSVMTHENEHAKRIKGVRKAPKDFIKFNSCTGDEYRVLSNFCEVPGGIQWRGRHYPSAEHIYQMQLKAHPSCWHMFECGGKLGSLGSGFRAMGFADEELKKKLKYWGPIKSSSRPCMVGIVAKMAINHPEWVEGLQLKPKPEKHFTDEELVDIFKPILMAKWKCFRDFRVALMSVPRSTVLIEFSRGAERETRNGKAPRWTANVKDGYIYGENLCGRLMAMVRDEMLGEKQA
jgi:hypothetical protein